MQQYDLSVAQKLNILNKYIFYATDKTVGFITILNTHNAQYFYSIV